MATGGADGCIKFWEFLQPGAARHPDGEALPERVPSMGSDGSGTGSEGELEEGESEGEGAKAPVRYVRKVFAHDEGRVTCLSVFNHGRFLLSGGVAGGEVKVWNVITATLVRVLPGHEKGIACITTLRDRQRCITGSQDKTLRVWQCDKLAKEGE